SATSDQRWLTMTLGLSLLRAPYVGRPQARVTRICLSQASAKVMARSGCHQPALYGPAPVKQRFGAHGKIHELIDQFGPLDRSRVDLLANSKMTIAHGSGQIRFGNGFKAARRTLQSPLRAQHQATRFKLGYHIAVALRIFHDRDTHGLQERG